MRWERDVRLGARTRYGIGGPASRFGEPASRAELVEAIEALENEPHLVLGGGANLLVADRGVSRPVLRLAGELDFVHVDDETIHAGAAARLPALVSVARDAGRVGYRFLEAVPGTVGGGLRMNAGSRDEWLWHRVVWAEAVTPEGEVVRLAPGDVDYAYRRVTTPEEWIFLETRLTAEPGDAETVRRAHLEFRTAKVSSQVYALPSVGSTWKNPGPPHPSAWQVVDEVGMRGAWHGDAQIAERHANFIVNHGEAKANDVLELMAETRRRAHEQLGVRLDPEIRFWGFTADELARVGGLPC